MPVKKIIKSKGGTEKISKKKSENKVGAPTPLVIEKETSKKTIPEKITSASEITKKVTEEKYYEAVGRRKESIARVRLYTKKAADIISEERVLITINGKDYHEYLTDVSLWEVVEAPLKKLKSINRFKVTVVIHGGGKSGQADAIRHGIARTLVKFDQNFRKKLKRAGYLTRDPRAKERRKYGLKKARKAPRWAKR